MSHTATELSRTLYIEYTPLIQSWKSHKKILYYQSIDTNHWGVQVGTHKHTSSPTSMPLFCPVTYPISSLLYYTHGENPEGLEISGNLYSKNIPLSVARKQSVTVVLKAAAN